MTVDKRYEKEKIWCRAIVIQGPSVYIRYWILIDIKKQER
jgi:hypothetical protein